jgi:hypothetical protein
MSASGDGAETLSESFTSAVPSSTETDLAGLLNARTRGAHTIVSPIIELSRAVRHYAQQPHELI